MYIIIAINILLSGLIAKNIYVPNDYTKIQSAINASVNGDIIIVSSGTYIENINFFGKAITVKSINGPIATIIDGGLPINPNFGSTVSFINSEGPDSIISGFTLRNGKSFVTPEGAHLGGGIYCEQSSPIIVNNIISENYADSGGGIYCYGSNCKPYINKCLITDNYTAQGGAGGGIQLRLSDACIDHCIISNHKNGGGIAIWLNCKPILRYNIIKNNITFNTGGGIICSSSPNPIIEYNTITNNTAKQGGGIQLTNGFIKNNIITYNTAQYTSGGGYISGYGGGLDLLDGDNRLEGNLIAYNKAMCYGGGVRCYSAKFSDNIICHNVAGGGTMFDACGGGVYILFSDNYTFKNCIISNNEALNYGGGVYCNGYSKLFLQNNTLVNNKSTKGKGVYGQDGSSVTLVNSILWNDTVDDLFMETGIPDITYCNTMSNIPGVGNISANPMFVDNDNDDFHINYLSPCRNAGDNSWVKGTDDFEGNPRVAYGTVDMGADEFYKHLYVTGDKTPGGLIQGKFVGLPGTTPVGLFIGSGILPAPANTMWGEYWLQAPWFLFPLIPIPSNGILELPNTLPGSIPAPYDIPMQALIGLNADSLTNLEVIEVR
jgi:hypothetical protein